MTTTLKSSDIEGQTRAAKDFMPQVFDVTLTVAEANGTAQGGTVIVPGIAGKSFVPTHAAFCCTGSAGGATLIRIADEDGNVVLSHVVADCTDGAWVSHTGGTPVITKMNFPTATGKGLKLQPTVADITTTTAIRALVEGYYVDA